MATFIAPDEKLCPDSIRFDLESIFLQNLLKDSDYKSEVKNPELPKLPSDHSLSLLQDGVKVALQEGKGLSIHVDNFKMLVNNTKKVEIYLCDFFMENARLSTHESVIQITFLGGLTNNLRYPEEFAFTIGHELGHHALKHRIDGAWDARRVHRALTKKYAKDPKQSSWSAKDESLFKKTSRYLQVCEFSADRFGLLLSQNLHHCIGSLMNQSVGKINSQLLLQNEISHEAFLEQGHELINRDDCSNSWRSHPYTPLRAVALEQFYESDVCGFFSDVPKRKQKSLDVIEAGMHWL
jgi:hypothetical protein